MNWRTLNSRKDKGGIDYYIAAISYAQNLWQRDLPSRAFLALDRALFTELTGEEKELLTWPLPYRAMAWMMRHYQEEHFMGNLRIHFQHLATRVRGYRKDQLKWRAWACWYLTRQYRPGLPGDPNQEIKEPHFETILMGLQEFGLKDEAGAWRAVTEEGPDIIPE